ncbi:MAG: hypothetical protein Fur0021_23840 [Candidatus Promineifilaceae bacterium]
MITLHLHGQQEKLSPDNPWHLPQPPLYHQWRTFDALRQPENHLIVNSYNTGTGKTRAALLHLFTLDKSKQNVLFVAPTNALISQHVADAAAFIQHHGLDFHVMAATAGITRDLSQQLTIQGSYTLVRVGETLDRLVRNYREFIPDAHQRKGLLLVTNPDILYYALTWRYGTHDQRNLFERFLTAFNYIIIDEFHYYDQKQLAFFLFFFAISQQMGYFQHAARKICLLSATPDAHITHYLHQLFGNHWQHISPDNEPAASDNYPTTPTLTPLNLTLLSVGLEEWGQHNAPLLRRWTEQEQLDGAIISDSLRRINRLNALLRPYFDYEMRITGPEPEAARQQATARPLILATPTVDIGYNFDKKGKTRQNVDFLITEARYGDDLIQRLGRAGRILGKTETSRPSQAIALLKEDALDALRPYHGQTLSRTEFKRLIQKHADLLPPKQNLTRYIRTWSITELFYPIYRAEKLVDDPTKAELENLFERLRDLFQARATHKGLAHYFRTLYYRQRWLEQTKNKPIPFNRDTAQHVADWLRFRGEAQYEPADIEPHLHDLLAHPLEQEDFRRFIASQVHLTQSLFNFRDSFDGPTAVVYDPDRLLSSQEINSYDLFHLVETYEVQWLHNRAEFIQLCGETEQKGALYGQLVSHRQPPLSLELVYHTRETQAEFAQRWTCRPVALDGIQLRAREHKGDRVIIDSRIAEVVKGSFIPLLLIPQQLSGHAFRALRHAPFYNHRLTIDFSDQQGVIYTAYTGNAAWMAHAELQTAFKIGQKMQTEAIIL